MKNIYLFLVFISFCCNQILAQKVGIGTLTPTIGKLEVFGVNFGGNTSAAFGTDGAGISLQRNTPAIGFNQYRDSQTPGNENGRYMANGKAALMDFNHTTGTFSIKMFDYGLKDAQIGIGNNALTILKNGAAAISNATADSQIGLKVGRGTSLLSSSTAFFDGSENVSVFNYDLEENTYIRPGRPKGKIIINEVPNGKVVMSNQTRIGQGGTDSPVVALDLFGALALTKVETVFFCGVYTYTPTNTSRAKLYACNTGPSELKLGDGSVFGQILILDIVETNSSYRILMRDQGNLDISGDELVKYVDFDMMLIWRDLGNGVGRWTKMNTNPN
jgi:hypothetical protein